MNKINKTELLSIYEELKGLLTSINKEGSWFDDNGFSKHANSIIERTGSICSEINIDEYKIQSDFASGRGNIIHTVIAKSKINSLIGRLKGKYNLEISSTNSGPTFIQNQQMNIELMLDVRGQIEKHLERYSAKDPEREFLEELKSKISTVKSAMDILKLIISLAKEYKITLATLIKIFST